jgi:hypothetical protein
MFSIVLQFTVCEHFFCFADELKLTQRKEDGRGLDRTAGALLTCTLRQPCYLATLSAVLLWGTHSLALIRPCMMFASSCCSF